MKKSQVFVFSKLHSHGVVCMIYQVLEGDLLKKLAIWFGSNFSFVMCF